LYTTYKGRSSVHCLPREGSFVHCLLASPNSLTGLHSLAGAELALNLLKTGFFLSPGYLSYLKKSGFLVEIGLDSWNSKFFKKRFRCMPSLE